MKIGMVGMGKLGLPVALAIESKGHEVMGYDINPKVADYLQERKIPYKEADLQPLLNETKIEIAPVHRLVAECDIIFVAIQTPHEPQYEGATRIPDTRKDFDYTHLKTALEEICSAAYSQKKDTIVAVISTCLPGTYNRELKPLLNEHIKYVYTPQFIAMGTVLADYLDPEFALIGVEDAHAARVLGEFYETLFDKPHVGTDITTAEGIKVSYNTFITMKTVLANTWGELSHKLGMNVDDIFKAWSLSSKRLMSPRYLKSGVGDGGGCHPRDNIALSWLAQETHLSHNLFDDLMVSREQHMQWIASLALDESKRTEELPIIILGKSFKPETNIETGSPAVLLKNILTEVKEVQHYEDLTVLPKAVYVIGTQHERYVDYGFPKGSVVIDPFRYIPELEGVTIISIGK